MTLLHTANLIAGRIIAAEGKPLPVDENGQITTEHPILPPNKELIPGTLASLIVFYALYKFAWPSINKFFKDRTARIQGQLDDSSAARSAAETEAERIRAAKGDIDAERSRLYAQADAQAEQVLASGRARIDAEMAELETRTDAEIASAAGRSGDELRAEIARYASASIDRAVGSTLDDATQQDLIEGFIARVGSSTGVSA